MKLFIGLGNPGVNYQKNRHNIGFRAIDTLANAWQGASFRQKFESEYSDVIFSSEKVVLIKPQTYMNNSGVAVRKWCDFYKIPPTNVYVFYDDLDLPFATYRLKYTGSAGGHNGMKSIIQHLGTTEFKRIRLGISRPVHGSVIDYVLGDFSGAEEKVLAEEFLPRIVTIGTDLVVENFQKVMTIYNGKNQK